MLNDFSILLFRVQSVLSDVQKEGLGQTVLRSVFATTTENVTLKVDSVNVLKVSLVTGTRVKVDLWTPCGCFCLFLLFLCRCLSSMLTGATSNVLALSSIFFVLQPGYDFLSVNGSNLSMFFSKIQAKPNSRGTGMQNF